MGRKTRGGRTTGVRYEGDRRTKFRSEEDGEKEKGVKTYKGEESDEKNRGKQGV